MRMDLVWYGSIKYTQFQIASEADLFYSISKIDIWCDIALDEAHELTGMDFSNLATSSVFLAVEKRRLLKENSKLIGESDRIK